MKLTINELERVFQLSLAYLGQEKVQKIRFENDDYYPKVWRKDIKLDDPGFIKCPDFVMGSLDDDIDGLKDVLIGKFEMCFLDLERLGAILSTLGALLEEKKYFQSNDNERRPEFSVGELKLLFETAPIFIRNQDVNEIFFEKTDDHYLKILHKDVNFNDYKFLDCLPYVIASLNEDISDLKKVLAGEVKMDGVYLQKLGAVLTAVGETI